MDPAIQFFLSHDRVPYRNEQTEWRFCTKSNGLFFDRYPKKGYAQEAASLTKPDTCL